MNIMEQKTGELVTIDGERKLELETLLKTSAYILGANGSNIMYKAVLEDGTTLLVRRISESVMERFKDFENQVKIIAKLVNPNLINIRGFYWGTEEKLVIYDFVPNGSLADAHYSVKNVVSRQKCRHTGAGIDVFYLRMTTFVVGPHKCGKLPRMSSLRSWFLPKADDLRGRASQMW
ncbi:hypothetical protein FXO37_32472 [Capsicum annuum]|nr:hypothetical protein FXO37_32472 [Capsicum annuum]